MLSPKKASARAKGALQYIALTLTLVLLWCLWAAGATPVFLLGCLLLGLAFAIRLTKRSIDHCFMDGDGSMAANGNPRLTAVLVERTIRFVLIMAALGLALWIWEVDFAAINSVNSRVSRLIHGGIVAGIILLAANFVWSMAANADRPEDREDARRGGSRTGQPVCNAASRCCATFSGLQSPPSPS